jgi:hypothetical protein
VEKEAAMGGENRWQMMNRVWGFKTAVGSRSGQWGVEMGGGESKQVVGCLSGS